MFRSEPARWFEVLVAHDDCAAALAALAARGAIELEARAMPVMLAPLVELKPLLERYAELARRFASYWPVPQMHAEPPAERSRAESLAPREVLLRALGRLSMWHATAEPLVRTLQSIENEARMLAAWRTLFDRLRGSPLDFGLLAAESPVLERRLYRFPAEVVPPPVPEGLLALAFTFGDERGLLLIAPPGTLEEFHREATALKGRQLPLPRWLHGQAADNLEAVERRARRAQRGAERLRGMLARLGESYGLAPALGDIERLRWFATQVERLPASEHFAWIHGWTRATETELDAQLAASGTRALLRFAAPPPGIVPPRLLRNPAWARPFELFARALGVPGGDELDPSALLALIVPLLFGYMFADLGQGLVLLAAGLALARRYPFARLLVAGGASAMVFGALFGSVFAREGWLPAAWLHPLEQPLWVLGVPVVAGALLLTLGLALNGVQARWRGEGRRWLASEAGVLVAYVFALPAFFAAPLWWLVAAGLSWALIGHVLRARRLEAFVAGSAHLLEQSFQLAVNTLSFTRVGAFALAHAGLSSAVVVLADAAGHPLAAFAVMLLGNLVILVLEALVVSIQTTRLVLFEFFIRFLIGTGRPFRPLPPPSPTLIPTRSPA